MNEIEGTRPISCSQALARWNQEVKSSRMGFKYFSSGWILMVPKHSLLKYFTLTFTRHKSSKLEGSGPPLNGSGLSPSRIVTFLPVQKSFVPAGPKCDLFREGCDKKRHKFKKIFSCARHSSQKCDKCDASHFSSPEKVTNVTSLTQIWDGKLARNPGKTDP